MIELVRIGTPWACAVVGKPSSCILATCSGRRMCSRNHVTVDALLFYTPIRGCSAPEPSWDLILALLCCWQPQQGPTGRSGVLLYLPWLYRCLSTSSARNSTESQEAVMKRKGLAGLHKSSDLESCPSPPFPRPRHLPQLQTRATPHGLTGPVGCPWRTSKRPRAARAQGHDQAR